MYSNSLCTLSSYSYGEIAAIVLSYSSPCNVCYAAWALIREDNFGEIWFASLEFIDCFNSSQIYFFYSNYFPQLVKFHCIFNFSRALNFDKRWAFNSLGWSVMDRHEVVSVYINWNGFKNQHLLLMVVYVITCPNLLATSMNIFQT